MDETPEEHKDELDDVMYAAEAASKEAVHKARGAQQAVEIARAAQIELAINTSSKRTEDALVFALRKVFGENEKSGRFIDVSQIPLICKSIVDMHEKITEMKQDLENKYVTRYEFNPVRAIAFGLASLLLTATVGAMVAMVFK